MKESVNNLQRGTEERCKEILQRHLTSFLENDLETLMSDFTNESVLITPDTTYTGLTEIRDFFNNLMSNFPKQKSTVDLDRSVIKGEVIYIVWHGKSPSLEVPFATDTFIIKNDKIWRQTFAGQIKVIG